MGTWLSRLLAAGDELPSEEDVDVGSLTPENERSLKAALSSLMARRCELNARISSFREFGFLDQAREREGEVVALNRRIDVVRNQLRGLRGDLRLLVDALNDGPGSWTG
jgi:hypothetical protein